jgi:uncharacterized membrane protein YkvA (DUF1232 family)
MEDSQTIIELFAFCLAWWLGLYLLGRDLRNIQLRFTGLGLLTYALGLAAVLMSRFATEPKMEEALARWGWPFLFLPALFWFGSMIYLLPEEAPLRERLGRAVERGLVPIAIIFYLIASLSELIITNSDGDLSPGPLYPLFAVLLVDLLIAALLFVILGFKRRQQSYPRNVLLVATLFFGLGTGLLLLPLNILPDWILILGIGVDLAILGFTIAVLDAFSQGEALLPDITRSLGFNIFAILLFGGQVVLAMVFSTGITLPMLVLLLAIVISAVIVQTFADPIQAGLDWIVFVAFPECGVRELTCVWFRAHFRARGNHWIRMS